MRAIGRRLRLATIGALGLSCLCGLVITGAGRGAGGAPGLGGGIHAPRQAGGQFAIAGPDGAMWMIDPGAPALVRVSLSGRVRSFRLWGATNDSFGLVVGPNGDLWFTEDNSIVDSTTSGRMSQVPVTGVKGGSRYARYGGLTVGPRQSAWFTVSGESGGVYVGHAGPGKAVLVAAERCCGSNLPGAITTGPDGALWTYDGAHIFRVTPAGAVRRFYHPAHPPPGDVDGPSDAIATAEGYLWLADQSAVGRLSTNGGYKRISFGRYPVDSVESLAAGTDGELWFVTSQNSRGSSSDDAAGEIDRSGHVTLYPLPQGSFPVSIAAAPDGRMWITTNYGTTAGTPTIYTITPRRPASGWPRAATPSVRVDQLSATHVTVTAGCAGSPGSFCRGAVSVKERQGRLAEEGTRTLVLAAGTSVTVPVETRLGHTLAHTAPTTVTGRFQVKDFSGRKRQATNTRRFARLG